MIRLIAVFICILITYVSSASLVSKSSDDYGPCESGWYYFRDKCYKSEGREPSERLSWHDALARCKSYGADLASIQSQEEQDFVAAYLLLNTSWWSWIGLNDFYDIGHFKWTDGSEYSYSNWHHDNPSYYYLGQPEYCVQLNMFPDVFGTWNDRDCNEAFAYICEKNANEEVSSPNPMYCTLEEGGGLKNKNSCYHVIQERKSWDNAEKYCKEHYNGHLLTVSDLMEDYFLDLAIPGIKEDMWIGIKIENTREPKWTSGWFVAYENCNIRGGFFFEGYCGARKESERWSTMPCSTELPFICEVSKDKPPFLKPPPVGAHCPEKQDYWRDFGGEYCYYFEPRTVVTFDEANEICTSRGGQMASLHSQEEADVLQPFFKYIQWSIHIGLHRNENGTFSWIDGTELDYQNWIDGEPDNVEEPLFENWGGPDKVQEPCVEMWVLNKKWNDIPCNKHDVGYVCSVKKTVSDSNLNYETISIETDNFTMTTFDDDQPFNSTSAKGMSIFGDIQPLNLTSENEMPTFDDEQPLYLTPEKESPTSDDIQALTEMLQEEILRLEYIRALNATLQEELLALQKLNATLQKEKFSFYDILAPNATLEKEKPTFVDIQTINGTLEEEVTEFDKAQTLNATSGK